MSIFVAGCGAVSPAGWGIDCMVEAVLGGKPAAEKTLQRSGWEKALRLRTVPQPAERPAFIAHARLRRASPLSQYAAGAVLECLAHVSVDNARLGLICCLQSGPVQYACRFYEEVRRDPSTASPLLFPETVFSAPASHIAALIGAVPVATTLLGDPGTFLQGIAMAAAWLEDGIVESCVVLAGEEFNWVHANAVWHLDPNSVLGAGAGAVLLSKAPAQPGDVLLEAITDAHTYAGQFACEKAAAAAQAELTRSFSMPAECSRELLCDSRGGAKRMDSAEANAWSGWSGARLSPKVVLGEGLMAGAAWQVALAVELVRRGTYDAANVSIVGVNQQAIAARLSREP